VAISRKLLTDGESVVVDTRTHPKALVLPGVVLVVTLAVAIFLDRKVSNGIASLLIWVLALVVVLWWVLRPFLDWLTATYTVTSKRLITREGLISRRGHDIPLLRISDVAYDQGILDRMLGCGTLVISDASTHGSVRLHDIPHVEQVQRQLTELLAGGGAPGTSSGAAERRDDDGT
jgi:uncharacterized membrane protein YdbT with pleckstrin-like domain